LIAVGTQAPDFTLPDHRGEDVSLGDYRGRKVMLAFYPKDFSPVCSDQLSIYQEVKPQLDEQGLELLGVSIDHSWAHRAFRKVLGIEFTLLADFLPRGEVMEAYGAYLPDRGTSNRSLVLIDEAGVVRWVHECEAPAEIPGANLIFDALGELAAESAQNGQ
jgi:peroxiredoxin